LMKTQRRSLVLALMIAAMLAAQAGAAVVNDRDPPIPLPPGPGGAGDTPVLQQIFDDITVGGPGIDAVADQTNFALFTTTASGGGVASFIIELALGGGPGDFGDGPNRFGIYKSDSPEVKAEIFGPQHESGDLASLEFFAPSALFPGGFVTITVKKLVGADPVTGLPVFDITSTSVLNFGNVFGFYMDVYDGEASSRGPGSATGDGDSDTLDWTVYTEDSLNGDAPGALVYKGDGETVLEIPSRPSGTFITNDYIFAFDKMNSKTRDFADLVVLVESIEPVPEPLSVVVWGLLGMIGVGFHQWRRRRVA